MKLKYLQVDTLRTSTDLQPCTDKLARLVNMHIEHSLGSCTSMLYMTRLKTIIYDDKSMRLTFCHCLRNFA